MLYIFSATNELAIANGLHSYTPAKHLRDFEEDLAFLPYYFCDNKDIIMIDKHISKEYKERINCLHDKEVECIKKKDVNLFLSKNKNIHSLAPWGWSPKMHYELSRIKPFCKPLASIIASWRSNSKEVYSRVFARDVLIHILNNTKRESIYIPKNNIPEVITSFNEIVELSQKHNKLVIKTPFSSSGRGMIFLNDGLIHKTYQQWIEGALKTHEYLMVEKYVNKLYDLSFHFEVKGEEIKHLGNASFFTLDNGQYEGNNITVLPNNFPDNQREFVEKYSEQISNDLLDAFTKVDLVHKYQGIIGVDVLLFLDDNGKLKFHPCLEMNMRYNMGTVTLALRNHLNVGQSGYWKVERLGKRDAILFDQEQQKKFPILLDDYGKIIKGYLPLIEPSKEKKFACYIILE